MADAKDEDGNPLAPGYTNAASASLMGNNQLGTSFGSGTDATSGANPTSPTVSPYAGMGTGATQAMNAGGSAGAALTSAGMYGVMSGAALGPAGLAAGIGLSMYEQSVQADNANAKANADAANAQHNNVQAALNQSLTAARMLGVGA